MLETTDEMTLLIIKIIKIELILSLIDNANNTVDCKIYNTYNSNFLCVKYYKKINLISINNNLGDFEILYYQIRQKLI